MGSTRRAPVDMVALLAAAHAGPTLAVTGFALAWGRFGVGLPTATLLLLGVAVLTGQLGIGWCNDWADAGRDTAAGRSDKPVVTGRVTRGQVGTACLLAGTACVGSSLALGVVPGLVHLVAVAAGLAYDLGLKSTLVSPLPYAVAFGLLPAVATLAAPQPTWPPVAMLAAALLGVAAHLANTVADADDDARTGVRGLPQRLGPRASAVGAGVVVVLAAAVLLPGAVTAGGSRSTVATALLGAGVVLGGLAVHRVLRSSDHPAEAGSVGRQVGRSAFWLVVAAAGAVVLGFVSS